MDRDQCWQVVTDERLSLADLLEGLTDAEWETPSLCVGWRVRDVAAHVAMAPQVPSVWSLTKDGMRAGGRFHKLNHDVAVRHAASRSPGSLVAELREHAWSHRLPLVTNYRNILFDVLVHGQDIALPLGRTQRMPLDAAAAGATGCGRWGGRSGPATGSAASGSSQPTWAGPPAQASRCPARSTPCFCCSPAASTPCVRDSADPVSPAWRRASGPAAAVAGRRMTRSAPHGLVRDIPGQDPRTACPE